MFDFWLSLSLYVSLSLSISSTIVPPLQVASTRSKKKKKKQPNRTMVMGVLQVQSSNLFYTWQSKSKLSIRTPFLIDYIWRYVTNWLERLSYFHIYIYIYIYEFVRIVRYWIERKMKKNEYFYVWTLKEVDKHFTLYRILNHIYFIWFVKIMWWFIIFQFN